jgi:hypothetical protein
MKIVLAIISILVISTVTSTFLETKVSISKIKISVIHNVHGNAMTHIVPLFATQFANPLNATLVVPNQKTPSVTLNAKNQNAKSNVQIKVAKCSIAQNVLQYAKLLIV